MDVRRRTSRRSQQRLPLAALGLAIILVLPSTGAAQVMDGLPSLPQLPLETYEPAVRGPIAEAFEDARAEPLDAARNGLLGMVLYAHEQYEFAAPCFERAHILDRGEGRWAYYLGRTEFYLGDYGRAAASLIEALRTRGAPYVPAQVLLAQALLEAGNLEQSRTAYEQTLADEPDTAAAHYGLGRIAASQNATEEAVRHLERAVELYPTFGAAHFALAKAYRELGERDKAQGQLALYQKDKDGWPPLDDPFLQDILGMRDSPTTRLRQGIELAAAGQLDEAAAAHEAALEGDANLVLAHVNLIRIYGELGEREKAEEHYRAALALDPNLAELHYNYGVLLVETDAGKAAEAFRRALELKPTYAEAHGNYAYLLMTSGRLDEAAEHYLKALEEQPDNRGARFNLARILVQQQRNQEAIVHLEQLLVPEDDSTPMFTYALGAAHARAGNREEALRYMQQAREKASGRGQSDLVASIDRDLQALQQAAAAP